jgi:hypothetical protein
MAVTVAANRHLPAVAEHERAGALDLASLIETPG